MAFWCYLSASEKREFPVLCITPLVSWAPWICKSLHFITEANWKHVSVHSVFVMLFENLLLNTSLISTSLKGFHWGIGIVQFYLRRWSAFSRFLAALGPVGVLAWVTLALAPPRHEFLCCFFSHIGSFTLPDTTSEACSPSTETFLPCQQLLLQWWPRCLLYWALY